MLNRIRAVALLLCVPLVANAGLVLTQIGNPDRTSVFTLNLCCASSIELASPLDSQVLEEQQVGSNPGSARAEAIAQEHGLQLALLADNAAQVSAQVVFIFQVDAPYRGLVTGAFGFDGGAAPFLQIDALLGNESGILFRYAADNRGDATPENGLSLGDVSPDASVFSYIGVPIVDLLPGQTYTFSATLITVGLGTASNGTARTANGTIALELLAVPEPSTAWLLAIAALGAFASRPISRSVARRRNAI